MCHLAHKKVPAVWHLVAVYVCVCECGPRRWQKINRPPSHSLPILFPSSAPAEEWQADAIVPTPHNTHTHDPTPPPLLLTLSGTGKCASFGSDRASPTRTTRQAPIRVTDKTDSYHQPAEGWRKWRDFRDPPTRGITLLIQDTAALSNLWSNCTIAFCKLRPTKNTLLQSLQALSLLDRKLWTSETRQPWPVWCLALNVGCWRFNP